MSHSIDADSLDTGDRRGIKDLYRARGIVPSLRLEDFTCPHLRGCLASVKAQEQHFHAGGWAYVGSNYGNAIVSGHRISILFVAMERGGGEGVRAEEIPFEHTQAAYREGAEARWNPHMGGTSQIMEFLVDEKARESYSLRFALTNGVKCVERTGNQDSGTTQEMVDNCSDHLRAEIDLLRPHLVITQGGHPKRTILTLFQPRRIGQFSGEKDTAEVFTATRLVILASPHPRRFLFKRGGWSKGNGPLPEYVSAAIRCASDEVIRLRSAST